jgi:DnaJ family protein C protein 7
MFNGMGGMGGMHGGGMQIDPEMLFHMMNGGGGGGFSFGGHPGRGRGRGFNDFGF